jgi:hypothetical protein
MSASDARADQPEVEDLLPLVLHEAGHAVSAVVLAFDLRSVELMNDESSTDLAGYIGLSGETASSASDVDPTDPDSTNKHRSAVVAMAGPEARRLK